MPQTFKGESMFNEEYIAAQAVDDKGFVIVNKTDEPTIKAMQKQIDDFASSYRKNGVRLNKEFHNTINALKNYAASTGDGAEVNATIYSLQEREKRGEFAAKPTNSNYQPSPQQANQAAQPQAQQPQSSQAPQPQQYNQPANAEPKNKFESFKNENGYVIVAKPKTPEQEVISKRLDEYFKANIKGKGHSKDFINQFNETRNFLTRTTATDEKIQQSLKSIEYKAQKDLQRDAISDSANQNDRIDALTKLVEQQIAQNAQILKNQEAIISMLNNTPKSAQKDRPLGYLSHAEVVAATNATKQEWVAAGQMNPEHKRSKEDYAMLHALNGVAFKDAGELKSAIRDVENKVIARLQSAQAPSPDELDPNDSSAMDEIRAQERANPSNRPSQRA